MQDGVSYLWCIEYFETVLHPACCSAQKKQKARWLGPARESRPKSAKDRLPENEDLAHQIAPQFTGKLACTRLHYATPPCLSLH